MVPMPHCNQHHNIMTPTQNASRAPHSLGWAAICLLEGNLAADDGRDCSSEMQASKDDGAEHERCCVGPQSLWQGKSSKADIDMAHLVGHFVLPWAPNRCGFRDENEAWTVIGDLICKRRVVAGAGYIPMARYGFGAGKGFMQNWDTVYCRFRDLKAFSERLLLLPVHAWGGVSPVEDFVFSRERTVFIINSLPRPLLNHRWLLIVSISRDVMNQLMASLNCLLKKNKLANSLHI